MFDPTAFYSFLKWAAPLLGASGFLLTLRKDFLKRADDWANTLLNNHLAHIQASMSEVVIETKLTNDLLRTADRRDLDSVIRVGEVKQALILNQDKQQVVWDGVLKSLTLLEDRTRPSSRPRTRRR